MPPNYQNGKIYKIESLAGGCLYIGSTTQSLSQRLGGHIAVYKRHKKGGGNDHTSFRVLDFPDYNIVLIESCPCNSKEELHAKEAEHIKSVDCVNRVIPERTNKEHTAEKQRQWREANKEQVAETKKQWREANKEWLATYNKQTHQKITCPTCAKTMGAYYLTHTHYKRAHPDLPVPFIRYNNIPADGGEPFARAYIPESSDVAIE